MVVRGWHSTIVDSEVARGRADCFAIAQRLTSAPTPNIKFKCGAEMRAEQAPPLRPGSGERQSLRAEAAGLPDFFAIVRGGDFYGAAHFVEARADARADAVG